jgi:hypothetical protein
MEFFFTLQICPLRTKADTPRVEYVLKLPFAKAEHIVVHIGTEEHEFRFRLTKPLNLSWQDPYVNNFSSIYRHKYGPQNEEENHGTNLNVVLRFNDTSVLL